MPDIQRPMGMTEPSEEPSELEASYEEEVPGHTPGMAEGDDEEAPHRGAHDTRL